MDAKLEGPYIVKKAFSGGALILTEMDGKNLPNPVSRGEACSSLAMPELTRRRDATSWGINEVFEVKATSYKSYTSESYNGSDQIYHGESYLPEVPMEQMEAINLISLKLQWSRYKSYLPEVAMEQTEDNKSYLSEVAVEQVEGTNLIPLKLQWGRLKL
ncbi:Ribulose bisphosphate carboxylase small chain 5, chloroplastic [Gossypium australe]|uniref:Ribulose bisphosphate carboxylase small chain 5, chloroplastic n=1 Tax=Gossypium australe TaxID=47621 RepID=A0A5B6VJM8_9ROSI|nr:Ribulose bisphosphate carboxylase small chain 5, chloroplastic [Gossypium australe]